MAFFIVLCHSIVEFLLKKRIMLKMYKYRGSFKGNKYFSSILADKSLSIFTTVQLEVMTWKMEATITSLELRNFICIKTSVDNWNKTNNCVNTCSEKIF